MVLGKNETTRSMCRKEFREIPGGDHRILEYWADGQPRFRTKVSHGGSDDLDDRLIGEMAKQVHLKSRQFFDFVKCRISKEQYRQMLIDKGVIKE
jgi:hypothetical protein